MIDLHSHVLAGLDDGARTLEESIEIARAAAAEGVIALAATPHVRADYPTSAAHMEARVSELREELARQGIELSILTGGEVSLDRLRVVNLAELRRFGLGGNPDYLLLESPNTGWTVEIAHAVQELRRRGITPVIAHPERNPEIQASPVGIGPLVAAGALIQITAPSLDGRFGKDTRRTALELIENGLAHLVASDAHGPGVREMGLRAALKTIGDRRLAQWLSEDVPAAIVSGTPIPTRPQKRTRTRWRAWG